MLRKTLSFGSTLLLAGAALLVTPGLGWAQHRGGGHGGGGGHVGAVHSGGFRGGVSHGAVHYGGAHYTAPRAGVYPGGAYRGAYHAGAARGYAYPGYGYRYGYHNGYRYPGYYNHYRHSYYPFLGLLGSYAYLYSYPYAYSYLYTYSSYSYGAYDHDLGYPYGYGDVLPYYPDDYTSAMPPAADYQSYYPPSTLSTTTGDTRAHVTVRVPADAQVWFEGTATTSTGPVREFYSPPLSAGQRYVYTIRARWTENGQDVTQTQQVYVTAGSQVEVEFPLPPKPAR